MTIWVPRSPMNPDLCQTPLAKEFDHLLFIVFSDVHGHMVAALNLVQRLKTEELPASVTKRVCLFYGQLLNDTAGGAGALATHGIQRPLFGLMRSIYEYAVRNLYCIENKDFAIAHATDLFNKEHRLFDDIDASAPIKEAFKAQAEAFMVQHPDWKRPPDMSLKDMLISLYGPALGESLYKNYHMFYSSVVHGHFDAMPSVIFFDGRGTLVKSGIDITNAAMSFILRVIFAVTCAWKREFALKLDGTVTLDHQYRVALERARLPFQIRCR
jgi:hypothetical protein